MFKSFTNKQISDETAFCRHFIVNKIASTYIGTRALRFKLRLNL